MIGIDRVDRPEFEDRLRIKGERIGLEPVDLRHRDLLWALLGRRRWLRPVDRVRHSWIVERPRKAFELEVARQAAADCIEPQQEARCYGR